jgi:hypothetical protein
MDFIDNPRLWRRANGMMGWLQSFVRARASARGLDFGSPVLDITACTAHARKITTLPICLGIESCRTPSSVCEGFSRVQYYIQQYMPVSCIMDVSIPAVMESLITQD